MQYHTLKKYSIIYIFDSKIKCSFGDKHQLKKINVKLYSTSNSIVDECVFECEKCKKKFIIKGNEDRFKKNYLYNVLREKQDKLLTEKQKQKIYAERKKEKEQLKKTDVIVDNKKEKALKLFNSNSIKVIDDVHKHDVKCYSFNTKNGSYKFYYCDECNILFCSKKEYVEYINNGLSKSKFNYEEILHVDLSYFMKKDKKKAKNNNNLNKQNIVKNTKTNGEKSIKINISKTENVKKILNKTLYVKTDDRRCALGNHNIENISVSIDLLASNGNKINKVIPAFYCEKCDIAYIYDEQYFDLVRHGQPLCLVLDKLIYKKIFHGTYSYFGYDSILTLYGYNVNQNEDLKDKQRHNILKNLVDTKIISKENAISHLRWLVRQRQSRKNHKNAIERWNNDIDFLINYNVNFTNSFCIDKIIKECIMLK